MDPGNMGDLDHTGHTNQAATQAVSEKSSESENALLRMILELWAVPPRCGYLGELRIFFVLLPRIFGCGGSFTRAFLLGRLV